MTTSKEQPVGESCQSPRSLKQWLWTRWPRALAGGFLVSVIAIFASGENTRRWLVLQGYLEPGGWFVDANWDFRFGSIWMFGMLLGVWIPDVRFPDKLGRLLLAGLIGVPVAVFCLMAMDSQMGVNAVERACARFEGFRFPPMLTPESEVSYFRPPVFRYEHFPLAGVFGFCMGVLFGWATAPGHPHCRHRMLLATIVLLIGVTCEWWWLRIRFDNYSNELQARIREYLAPADRARVP